MKRKREKLNTACIVSIIVLTILAIGGTILIHRFEYVAGTKNDVHMSMVYGFGLSLIFFFVMIPIATCSLILAVFNLVHRHSNLSQILSKLVLLILVPVIVICTFLYTIPLSPIFLKGFEQWILKEADIDAIQIWLASEGAKHAGKQYNARDGLSEKLPECLVNLKPKIISFKNYASRNGPSVEITWFFFMDDYGLIIGSPEMETPKKGRIKLTDRSAYEFRRPVKKGAYVFIRG